LSEIPDFNWNEFDESMEAQQAITHEHIEAILKGKGKIPKTRAVKALQDLTGFKQRAILRRSSWLSTSLSTHYCFQEAWSVFILT